MLLYVRYISTPIFLHILIFLFTFIHIPYYIYGTIVRFLENHIYFEDQSWPEIKSNYPAPVIRNISKSKGLFFAFWRRPLYISGVIYYTIEFFIDTLIGRRTNKVQHLSDEQFTDLIANGLFAQRLRRKNISKIFNESKIDPIVSPSSYDTDDLYYELDCMEHMNAYSKHCLPGLFSMGFNILFKGEVTIDNHVKLRVINIELKNKTILTPADGNAWKWAKVFALSGLKADNLYFVHPKKHFPVDALNAISSMMLPKSHIVRQLVEPHLEYQLTINNTVLHGGITVLKPEWWNFWATLSIPYESIMHLLDVYLQQRYQYCTSRLQFNTDFPYGRFLAAYYDVVYNFVKDILADIDSNDAVIRNWAHHTSLFVPGFPNESSILADSNTLINAIANYIFQVSVEHSADHYLLNAMPLRAVPHRLRITPPYDKCYPNIADNRACSMIDWLRQQLCDRVIAFNIPNPIKDTTLTGIHYGFSNKHLIERNIRFRTELIQTEQKLIKENNNLIPLKYLLKSVEY